MFHATCLAMPLIQMLSHYETSGFTGVTLSNVSCNLSLHHFDDHMRLKEYFHWLVLQTIATQVAGQMLHCAMLKKFLATVVESRTQFYFLQWLLQLVLHECSWPFQSMLQWAMIFAIFSQWYCETSCMDNYCSVTMP